MDVTPIARIAVSDAVYTRLAEQILSGRVPAGEPLPSERELALAFGVNRHAIREALKRLQQAGLVRISHGGKTRALDWRASVGLDALGALVAAGVIPPRTVIRDVAVMRRTIGADAARLCALEADAGQLDAVSKAAAAYPDTGQQPGAQFHELAVADLAFWTAVVEGSGNIAYRLALNTLVTAIDDLGVGTVHELGAGEFTDRRGHLRLAELIVARDGDAAFRQAHQLLSHLVSAI